jgi:hypothetical protein
MTRLAWMSLALLALIPFQSAAQQSTTSAVMLRFTREKDRHQIYQDATLTLDNTARRLVVTSKERPQSVSYDAVRKIIIEPDSGAKGPGFGSILAGFAVNSKLFRGQIKAAQLVYVEHAASDGTTAAFVLSVPEQAAEETIARIKSAFSDRVVVPVFSEAWEQLEEKQWKSVKKYDVRAVAGKPSLPEMRSDKGLIVVACPVSGGFEAIRTDKPYYHLSARILVNNDVVAVNGPGTYTAFYLDPGEHLLVSYLNDTTGLRLKVEGGQEYHLIQTVYIKGGNKSFLTRHSKDLVMHEIGSLMKADWKVKD